MNAIPTGDRHTPAGERGAATDRIRAERAAADGPAVLVRGLRCSYGDFEAVRGIDLHADHGELLAVLGTNGAGKTTAMDVLGGRRTPDRGDVRVLGHDPRRERRALARRAGVVLQESALPDELTPSEFLRLWQRLAGGGGRVHHPEDEQLVRVGLEHRRDVRIGRLSGGERRRLDMAVALSADPELLFLDEPTAGLDPESRADTWALIRELLRNGTTVVLTTHYLEEAEALADRLAILHEGQVVVGGTLEEVVTARDARIRCELTPETPMPFDVLTGCAEIVRGRRRHHVEIRTPDLVGDLRTLLAWSQQHGVQLHRLNASEPTLAEVFHDVRTVSPSGKVME